MPRKPSHGGSRKGAGRPRTTGPTTVHIGFRLSQFDYKRLMQIGSGSPGKRAKDVVLYAIWHLGPDMPGITSSGV